MYLSSRSRPASGSRSQFSRPGSASSVVLSRSQNSQVSLAPSIQYDTPDSSSISPTDSARSGMDSDRSGVDSVLDSDRSVISASDVDVAARSGAGEPVRPTPVQR